MTDTPRVTRLRDLAEEWFEMCDDIHEPITEAADLITELVDALRDCSSGLEYIRRVHGELYGVGFDRALGKAKTALAKAGEPT